MDPVRRTGQKRAHGSPRPSARAIEAAWAFFGGVFKVLIPDNTHAIVATADPPTPRMTPAFLEYAQACGFHIDPARVRRPCRTVLVIRTDHMLMTLKHARAG
jgi:hypothetical protein